MPPRSKISGLPVAVRTWLNDALAEGNFSGYERLAEELKARGYEVSKSALHRHGEKLEAELAEIKASCEAAKAIAAAAGDDEAAQSEALLSITQHHMLLALRNLGKAQSEKDAVERLGLLASAGKGISSIVNASIARKKHGMMTRKEFAAEVEQKLESGPRKLDAETYEFVRRAIRGEPA